MPSSDQPGFMSRLLLQPLFWAYFVAAVLAHVLLDTIQGDDLEYQKILLKSFLLAVGLTWVQKRNEGTTPSR